MKRIKPVLVYIAGTSPNAEEEKFLDGLGKAYALRNAQFYREVEAFEEVYNLTKYSVIDDAYGDKIVQSGLGKEKPKAKAKEEVKEVSAPKPARGRKSTPKGE